MVDFASGAVKRVLVGFFLRRALQLLLIVLALAVCACSPEDKAASGTLCFGAAGMLGRTFNWGEDDDPTSWNPFFDHLDGLSLTEIEAVQAVARKPGTPFETVLVQHLPVWAHTSWDGLKGTKLLRMHRFHEAGEVFGRAVAGNTGLYLVKKGELAAAFAEPERAYGSLTGAYDSGKRPNDLMPLPAESGPLADDIEIDADGALASARVAQGKGDFKTYKPGELEKRIRRLLETCAVPIATKADFARKMAALEELSRLPGEAGAQAMYVYAKGLMI